jgi:hypothetical protein
MRGSGAQIVQVGTMTISRRSFLHSLAARGGNAYGAMLALDLLGSPRAAAFALDGHGLRRERGHAASCCAPRALPSALVGGDSARRRITRAAFTSASSW